VLTAYHIMTIMLESTAVTKLLWTSTGASWLKQWGGPAA